MLTVAIMVDGLPSWVDLHALPIAQTFAHKLAGPDLFIELTKLGVPGVTASQGWQQLAVAYGVWRAEQKERAA